MLSCNFGPGSQDSQCRKRPETVLAGWGCMQLLRRCVRPTPLSASVHNSHPTWLDMMRWCNWHSCTYTCSAHLEHKLERRQHQRLCRPVFQGQPSSPCLEAPKSSLFTPSGDAPGIRPSTSELWGSRYGSPVSANVKGESRSRVLWRRMRVS